ncbi:organic cation transporter protein-like [Glandiceps talaboti]
MQLDDALVLLGDFGLYQNIIFWLVSIPGAFLGAFHIMAIVFLAGWPHTYHCNVPQGSYINETIPIEDYDDDGEPIYESCLIYTNSSVDNTTQSCTDGWYYESDYKETIVTEWDLVCDQAALSQISSSIYMFGVLLGAFTGGHLADRFGRKTTFLGSMWIQAVFGIMVAFSQNFITFCVLRFCVGFFQQGVMLSQFVLATELFTPSKRVYAGFLNCMCWGLGIMVLSVTAYVCQHWRVFQIVISVPGLLTFYYYWVIPESLRWLISRGRVHEAESILYTAARINKLTLPDHVLAETDNIKSSDNGIGHDRPEDVQDPKYNYLDLMKTGKMALYTTVMSFAWFVSSLVYYGISYNTANFQGSVYLLFFLAGCVEIPAYALSMVCIVWWGRRWPTCLFLFVSGLACGTVIFIPDDADLLGLKITIVLLGKFGITGAFGTIYVWAPELYPTLLRNMGLAVFAFWASVGGIIAPLTVYLSSYNITIPMIVFGVLSLLSGVSVLLLPETKDKVMPRTIEQAAILAMNSQMAPRHLPDQPLEGVVDYPPSHQINKVTQTDF